MIDLKIGENVYRYVPNGIGNGGIWHYSIIERRENPEGMQYVVRSLACSHGWKCELLISEDDNGDLRYVRMVNNDEDDDQRHWHGHGLRFCLTRDDAKRDAYNDRLKSAKEYTAKCKANLDWAVKCEKELVDLIAVIESGEGK